MVGQKSKLSCSDIIFWLKWTLSIFKSHTLAVNKPVVIGQCSTHPLPPHMIRSVNCFPVNFSFFVKLIITKYLETFRQFLEAAFLSRDYCLLNHLISRFCFNFSFLERFSIKKNVLKRSVLAIPIDLFFMLNKVNTNYRNPRFHLPWMTKLIEYIRSFSREHEIKYPTPWGDFLIVQDWPDMYRGADKFCSLSAMIRALPSWSNQESIVCRLKMFKK